MYGKNRQTSDKTPAEHPGGGQQSYVKKHVYETMKKHLNNTVQYQETYIFIFL